MNPQLNQDDNDDDDDDDDRSMQHMERISSKHWSHCHGRIDPWVDMGHVPLFFEVEGTSCVLSPSTFSGVDIFCTNARGSYWIIGTIFVKFSQLILMKIIKIVPTRSQILRLKYTTFNFGWGSAPDPHGELTALPRPSSWM